MNNPFSIYIHGNHPAPNHVIAQEFFSYTYFHRLSCRGHPASSLKLFSQNSLVAFLPELPFCSPSLRIMNRLWVGREDSPAQPNPVMDRDLDPNQDFIQRLGWVGARGQPSTQNGHRPQSSSSSTITTITTTTTTLLLLLLLFNSIYTKVLNLIPLYKIRTGKSFFITFSFETPFLLVSHLYLLFKILMTCDGMKFWILWIIDWLLANQLSPNKTRFKTSLGSHSVCISRSLNKYEISKTNNA